MYHLAQSKASSARAASILVASGVFVSLPLSYALADSLDGFGGTRVAPVATFGIGCAVGAVLGGLVVGLANRSSKRKLRKELDEVLQIAERAEAAAQRAESLLDERSREVLYGGAAQEEQSTGALQREKVSAGKETFGESITLAPNSQTPQIVGESVETEVLVGKSVNTNAREQASEQRSRGVRAILQERLGTGALIDMPIIDRGQAREVRDAIPMIGARSTKQIDSRVRASIIDRRIPRFDESLYPDTVSEQHPQSDVFETAMRAMEDTLTASVANTAMDEQPTLDIVQPAMNGETIDTRSHVDYLIQEELERNRSGSARRYSRAHLTMYEGTGDLSAARKATQYRPRHMQAASKEA